MCIVTGAGRGIGRAAANALAREGYSLALNARTEAQLLDAQQKLPSSIIFPADISEPDHAAALIQRTIDHFRRLDAIVHCAGIAPMLSVEETTDAQWRAIARS